MDRNELTLYRQPSWWLPSRKVLAGFTMGMVLSVLLLIVAWHYGLDMAVFYASVAIALAKDIVGWAVHERMPPPDVKIVPRRSSRSRAERTDRM